MSGGGNDTPRLPCAPKVFWCWRQLAAVGSKLFVIGNILKVGSDYAQVERRSVTILDQTMSRGVTFGLKKCIKIIHCHNLNILMEKKFGLSIEVWVEHLLEKPNSWRHNFLKVLPPRLFWRRHPLDLGL